MAGSQFPAGNPWPPFCGAPSNNLVGAGTEFPDEIFCGFCLGPCRGPSGERAVWWETWQDYVTSQEEREVRIAYAGTDGKWVIPECICCRLWTQYYDARATYNLICRPEVRATLRSLGVAVPLPPDRPW